MITALTKDGIQGQIDHYTDSTEWNYIKAEEAISADMVGLRMYERPLVAYASAADPLFAQLLQPQVIGPHFMLPGDWLPEAKTVISVFCPFTEVVRVSNRGNIQTPSPQWLHGRVEGQRFIEMGARFLTACLQESGYAAVAPAIDERFCAAKGTEASQKGDWKGRLFTSNWSERHAGYISGLGTFGLSKGLITEKGMAGRMFSVITTAVFAPTERKYQELYEYCIDCGACVRNCPVQAITLENGKNHVPCGAYMVETGVRFSPRYGCGKCQTGVPCESRNPSARKLQK